jgi:hypothetical protein
MRRKLKTVLFVALPLLGVLLCATAWYLSLGLRQSAAKNKFPVGMSMQEATAMLHQPYHISTNTDSLDPSRYLINGDGLVLQFDQDEKLINTELLIIYK